jgi:hypothetical protein
MVAEYEKLMSFFLWNKLCFSATHIFLLAQPFMAGKGNNNTNSPVHGACKSFSSLKHQEAFPHVSYVSSAVLSLYLVNPFT